MAKNSLIKVQNIEVRLTQINSEDYICLSDMAQAKSDASKSNQIIQNWLRNRNIIEFLGVWEQMYNPSFNSLEFEAFKKEAGLNTFVLSPKKWIENTQAMGIVSKQGKYGGTYAHKDIAFNFGMWISPVFQLYIIKEYQRLKEIESNQYGLEWNVKRILSKANYQIQTDAVKNYIIPKANYSEAKQWLLYADEADLLNIALFGCTAKAWKEVNPQKALQGENIRDMASINELAILSNIESLNATLIRNGIDRKARLQILVETVKEQRVTLDKTDILKSIKKASESTFVDYQKNKKIDNN